MKNYFSCFLFILPLLSYCQRTKLVVKDRDRFYEEYEVLVDNKKVKHGHYLKLTKPYFDLMGQSYFEAIGEYDNDNKNGYWEHYYPNTNQIEKKGHYTLNLKDSLWIFYYADPDKKRLKEVQTSSGVSIEIDNINTRISKVGNFLNDDPIGVWEYYNENQELIQKYNFDTNTFLFDLNQDDLNNMKASYLGGEYFMYHDLYNFFDFENLMEKIGTKINLQTSLIKFEFNINQDGSIVAIKELENTISKKLASRALESLKGTNGFWSPDYINGEAQKTIKTIIFKIDVESQHFTYVTDKWTSSKLQKEFYLNINVE